MVLMVLFGLGAAMLLLGWIIPLVIANSLKHNGVENVRGWNIFAAVWGTVALSSIIGGSSCLYLALRGNSQNFGTTAAGDKFDTSKYKGATAYLKSSYAGEQSFTASVDGKKSTSFSTTNGIFTTPAAKLKITQYSVSGRDNSHVLWSVNGRFWQGKEQEVIEGIDNTLKIGPPFTAGVKMNWSGALKQIELSPICADSEGNEYKISSSSKSVLGFEFLDQSGSVIWKGNFEAG